MADRLHFTGRKGDSTEALIHDGRRLFHTLVNMLEGGTGADDLEPETVTACHMLASLGRDFMDEAVRACERERVR